MSFSSLPSREFTTSENVSSSVNTLYQYWLIICLSNIQIQSTSVQDQEGWFTTGKERSFLFYYINSHEVMYIPTWATWIIHSFRIEPWTQPHNESLKENVDTLTLLTQVADGRYQPLTLDGQSLNSRVSVN